jgi:hypothetical protein
MNQRIMPIRLSATEQAKFDPGGGERDFPDGVWKSVGCFVLGHAASL